MSNKQDRKTQRLFNNVTKSLLTQNNGLKRDPETGVLYEEPLKEEHPVGNLLLLRGSGPALAKGLEFIGEKMMPSALLKGVGQTFPKLAKATTAISPYADAGLLATWGAQGIREAKEAAKSGDAAGAIAGTSIAALPLMGINPEVAQELTATQKANKVARALNSNVKRGIQIEEINPRLKSTIDHLYAENPDLAQIGSKQQYAEYYKSLFPNSKVQTPYAHGTNSDLSKGLENSTKVINTGAPETEGLNDFYLNLQPEASLQYVQGLNSQPQNNWNKQYWTLKEIMGKPYRDSEWMSQPIKLRRNIPNRAGVFSRVKNSDGTFSGRGKLLEEYKSELGMDSASDSEFLNKLGVRNGETFNQFVARNKDIFDDIYNSGNYHGLYHVKINAENPLTINGGNTYYNERGIFNQMKANGNDVLLHNNAANEFGSDVAVIKNVTPDKVRILGSIPDKQQFSGSHYLYQTPKLDFSSTYHLRQGGILKAQKGTPNNGLPPWIKRDDSTRTYITAFKPGDKDGRTLLRNWQRGDGKQLIRDSSLVKRIGNDGRYIYIPRSLAGGMNGGSHISEFTGENKDSDEFIGRLRFVRMTEDGLYEYYDPLTGQNELYDTQFENGGKIHIKAKW